MKNSDLLQILHKLPDMELRALRKFIASPWANQRADVALLFDFIEKHREHAPTNLTREAAHEAVYPGLPFDDKQLRRLMSYLLKVVEKFLTINERMTDGRQNDIALAAAYRRLGLEKHARQALEAAADAQKTALGQDFHFYETQYQLEAEALAFHESAKRTAPRNLQAVNHSLDLAYLAKKLRQSCVALSHQAVANVEYDLGLLKLVLGYLDGNQILEQHPAIGLYFYFYQAATTGEEGYFDKLKAGILQFGNELPAGELRLIYLLAINYCIRRINEGAVRFNHALFELYSAALQSDVLLENGQLSRFAFKNIAALALGIGEFGWAERFIEKYSPAVDARHRRNYTDYNLAKLYHARREYSKALRLLQKVEYEDVFLNLDAKVLLMKIYFEQGETDVLESLLQSFQRFLQRKSKELGYHKENYMNTLHFAHKLLNINHLDKAEKERLRSEIIEAKALGERAWLLERL